VTCSLAFVAIYFEKNRASSLTFFGFHVVISVGFAERTVFGHGFERDCFVEVTRGLKDWFE
jgi:hypothetical protein